jgi:mannose-6-phosphate isomerase-like protein (cupin superfamily)
MKNWNTIACAGLAFSAFCLTFAQNPANFTGGTIKLITENSDGKIAHYHFDPGVRTKWHSHEGGQIILVEEGVGLNQVKGGPVKEMHAGDTVYVGPGVWHWHGSSPTQGGTQFNVSRGGITWGDAVTDKEFRTPPKK